MDDYDTAIAIIFETGFSKTRTNILQAFLDFYFLTYSLMESLAARQEAYIMRSYDETEKSCEDHADRTNLEERATLAHARLSAPRTTGLPTQYECGRGRRLL